MNRQADQWRGHGDEVYNQNPVPSKQQYPARREDESRHIMRMRTPSPQRTQQPWDPNIGLPHSIDVAAPYYRTASAAATQHAPALGAMFQNRSLDRSAIFGTGARRGLNNYLSESGRNWSQPSLAINRLVGAATGRRLPQPPPESQKPLAMPMPNTPLPMNQKPVALSFRNRKLPQVPANANSAVGGGPTLASTYTTSVTKTRTSVKSSKSFNLPFASAFMATDRNQPSAARGGPNRISRGAKLPVVPGTQPAGVSGFFGSITGRRQLPDRGQSRSLDYPGSGPTLETVVEAGRGVRKLPIQPGVMNRGGGPLTNIQTGGPMQVGPQVGPPVNNLVYQNGNCNTMGMMQMGPGPPPMQQQMGPCPPMNPMCPNGFIANHDDPQFALIQPEWT